MTNTEHNIPHETVVGSLELEMEHDFEVAQEYAGYAERVRVAPGSHKLVLVQNKYDRPYLIVRLYGEISQYCYGNPERDRTKIGTRGATSLQPYSYSVKDGGPAVVKFSDDGKFDKIIVARWKLLPGVEIPAGCR